VTEWTIDPAEFGYTDLTADALAGGDSADNARIIMEILDPSQAQSDRVAGRAAVVMNAAAAIYVSGNVSSYSEGVQVARQALERGDGIRALDGLRTAYAGG
jgi:anthranilate phosphoribosyltransferase